MDYNDFKSKQIDVFLSSEVTEYVLKEFIGYYEKLGLEKDIKLFYPKGLGTKNELNLLFFYDDKTISVTFPEIKNFKITNLSSIQKTELEVVAGSKYNRSLTISLSTDEEIVLNPAKDTDPSNADDFKEKIEEIYKFLN
ncbi:hypothetical protein [Oceanobacillus sp. FSL W7-1293]|uniref:hypothetical protein n=1 Tax=Oceanobacillus sp. FSL W7-1293 TaxID=2921699 RepID=UPI0030CB29FA